MSLNGLKEKIAEFLNDPLLRTLEIRDWEQLFGYFAKNLPEKRFYFIIDEFSYLIRSDPRVLSVLQKLGDTKFSSSSVLIALSGSMLGLMSEKVLSYASPLYGRRTRDIFLEGLPFKYILRTLSDWGLSRDMFPSLAHKKGDIFDKRQHL